MWGVIASPDDNVWLNNITDVVEHRLQCIRWHITQIAAPFPCLLRFLGGEAIRFVTAEVICTLGIGSDPVLIVDVRIRHVYSPQSLALGAVN
jgi:hypothetical protein